MWAVCCCVPATAAADPTLVPALLDPQQLEHQGAIIDKIIVQPNNIFDLDDPQEDRWLYRTMNRFHIVTKPQTVEKHLLFEPGDTYSERKAEESERILRGNSYINEANITPISYENGKVDLLVETYDVWTLTPDITLSRTGGETKYGFGLLEENLLGRGQQIGVSYVSDVDRDTIAFGFSDNNFQGTRYRLSVGAADSDDGHHIVE